ncbi:hypothetical protein [Cyanobium sp. ATX-6F1]|uniref:hypothetical protein n=1 Tax=Cyanobium sp. ATX-6F1 TaxID=3137388 RepID=UPI0039BE56C6
MLKSTWLDPIPGLWRDEAAHRYWLGEHLFPVSITGVLAHGLSATARRAIEAKRPVWEPRGNTVHAALERYSQARFSGGRNAEQALLAVEQLPGHHRYRDWILPLLQLPLWDEVQVIASERLSCCLTRNLAGGFDGAYASPALSDRRGREVRVLYDLKTLSAHGRPYSTAAQLGATWCWRPLRETTTSWARRSGAGPERQLRAPSTAVSSAWRPGPPPGAATAWRAGRSEQQRKHHRN